MDYWFTASLWRGIIILCSRYKFLGVSEGGQGIHLDPKHSRIWLEDRWWDFQSRIKTNWTLLNWFREDVVLHIFQVLRHGNGEKKFYEECFFLNHTSCFVKICLHIIASKCAEYPKKYSLWKSFLEQSCLHCHTRNHSIVFHSCGNFLVFRVIPWVQCSPPYFNYRLHVYETLVKPSGQFSASLEP